MIQPGTQGLMFTGNEKVWPYLDQARPAPRGHKVPVPGDVDGTKLVMDLLRDRVEEAGVEVRYETGASHLVTSPSGDVVGVEWKSFDTTGVVRAGAVVLAAGGFVMNPDMVAAHTPALGSKLFTLGSTYDDGLGIRLGASVGGELKHMDEPFITAPFYPPSVLVKGLIVNKLGERFVAEDSYHARTSYHVMQQPEQAAYLIVDSAHLEEQRMSLCPLIDGWETVEEMESGLGLPTGSLAKTLDRYNEHAARGEDPDFHKQPDWLARAGHRPLGRLRPDPRQGAVRRLHPRRAPDDRRRPGATVRRLGGRRPVRRRRLRLEPRPGRCRLLLGHPARRGVLLRAAGGPARGGSPRLTGDSEGSQPLQLPTSLRIPG